MLLLLYNNNSDFDQPDEMLYPSAGCCALLGRCMLPAVRTLLSSYNRIYPYTAGAAHHAGNSANAAAAAAQYRRRSAAI